MPYNFVKWYKCLLFEVLLCLIYVPEVTFSTSYPGPSVDSIPGPPTSIGSPLPSLPFHREGYFNKTSYARLTPIALNQHIALSFRSCIGGQLFSQRSLISSQQISLEVHREGLVFTAVIGAKRFETRLNVNLLDNGWHIVTLLYRLGNLSLSVSGHSEIVANSTHHPEILKISFNPSDNPEFLVGKGFVGCILEGPSIVLNSSNTQSHNVIWGPCVLSNEPCNTVDHCALDPCMTHGVCFSRGDRYQCHCSARYSGNNCEIDNGPPCAPNVNPCQNGAECEETSKGDYMCHCTPGFSGQHCEVENLFQACDNNPCSNNGSCRTIAGRKNVYECICTAGFTGKDCETNINECLSNPCQNGGSCIDGINNYTCFCGGTGYIGLNCEININECEKNPCLHSGTCFDTYGSFTCHCTPGFGGQTCEMNVNECSSFPCQNGGKCIDKIGSYQCHCPAGFTGENCESLINECKSIACPQNSVCLNKADSFQCVCKTGHSGVNCTETHVCVSAPCQNGGTCNPYYDTFNCTCAPGYTGVFCAYGIESGSNQLMDNQLSITGDGNFISGVQNLNSNQIEFSLTDSKKENDGGEGNLLDNYEEYDADNYLQLCGDTIDCRNDFTRGYNCTCLIGLTGQLYIYDCFIKPCFNGGSCVSITSTRFMCICPPGFIGALCQLNVDECLSNPCLNGGICLDGVDGYRCNCSEEFMGMNCEQEYNICAFKPCENNGTCINKTSHEYLCECKSGFEGPKCEKNINDCLKVECPDKKECVDLVNSYECRCPDGFVGENCTENISHCNNNPCKHNATCKDTSHNYTCHCAPGFEGRHCESDINECEKNKDICNYGICVNNAGSYQCFCRPGFSGDNCDVDFDECLSKPCFNGATCQNKINGFNCMCTPGYTGKECNTNINECQSNPCLNGATCIDGIATFSCVCPAGLTGFLCETNIDECQSSPCLHNGHCIDGINSYTCDCSNTGYEGSHCELNINDCISSPCINGAKCVDGVKDYDCICYVGYTGKNCEVDINECESNPCQFNGLCLEHSNTSLYVGRHPAVTTPGPIGTPALPKFFHQDFNYSIASGYECVCVPGVMGINCEVNIQECDSNPCFHGNCQDRIGGYVCECEDGFEGVHCETDINECEKYKPCVHGVCIDKRANYFCDCPSQFGGKNCSVELIGCNEPNACLNNGTCKPYLDNETEHKFNCTCPYGFHGQICEKITTMSLSGNSFVVVNTSRDEGYDISFRFKTTLPSGLLALGSGPTYYILKLAEGRLNLHSSILNKWDGVFIGSQLNDSNWHKVFVAINASHLVLSANEEQTIYPINLNEGASASHTSFPTTFIGGTVSNFRILSHGPPSFIGCTQNIIINGHWVVPKENLTVPSQFVDIEVGCPRKDQCNPNPCQNSGHCIDAWSKFNCTCERPFLGHTCQYNYTAATFGHENTSGSIVSVAVAPAARRAVRNIVDISMFIRTRQPRGAIFYLGSLAGTVSFSEETHIIAELEGGELLVRIQFSGSQESYTVGGVKLDDGHNHLIQVVRNITLVQVKINGTEYFRKTISATGQLDAQVLYLGGLPHSRSVPPPVRQTRNVPRFVRQAFDLISPFKGIIQDVQINNGILTMVVEFYPLRVSDIKIPTSFGNVSFDSSAVLQGVISDDSCASNPCANDGLCTVTWNDFSCACSLGYKGKKCQEMEFCQVQDCPEDSVCHNLHHGYECVANITLDGSGNTSLHYTLMKGDVSVPLNTIDVCFRSRQGGMLLHISDALFSNRAYFTIHVLKEQITVVWKLDSSGSRKVRKFGKEKPDGSWTCVSLKIGNNSIHGGLAEGSDEPGLTFIPTNFSTSDWENLVKTGVIMVGGGEIGLNDRVSFLSEEGDSSNNVEFSFPEMSTSTIEKYHYKLSKGSFKGCIGEIRIGGLLLPYFTEKQLNSSYADIRDRFLLTSPSESGFDHDHYFDLDLGCFLCSQSECLNGGNCSNPAESYTCNCSLGFEGDDCSVNIDECQNSACKNSATCVDGIANYTCVCPPGWEGWLCDVEINECLSNPCLNNGTCLDFVGYFDCSCTPEYVGKICDQLKQVTCANAPCRNGSTCIDVKNVETNDNFTCNCAEGYVGPYCETPYCRQEPCKNGGACITNRVVPFCECAPGFRGDLCEENIDDCEKSPCKNSGRCIDGIDSFSCNCSSTGYEGPTCEIDINECILLVAKCGDKGKCINENGGYRCDCEPSACGFNCELENPCFNFNPCQNGGSCEPVCIEMSDYQCVCPPGNAGKNCTESPEYAANNFSDIAIIVGPILAILMIAAAISLTVFIMMARKKRAMRGTYSPSSQEYSNPRVEMDNVMKPPPEERLI